MFVIAVSCLYLLTERNRARESARQVWRTGRRAEPALRGPGSGPAAEEGEGRGARGQGEGQDGDRHGEFKHGLYRLFAFLQRI